MKKVKIERANEIQATTPEVRSGDGDEDFPSFWHVLSAIGPLAMPLFVMSILTHFRKEESMRAHVDNVLGRVRCRPYENGCRPMLGFSDLEEMDPVPMVDLEFSHAVFHSSLKTQTEGDFESAWSNAPKSCL